MGYEISGAWGAKMAMPDREVITFVGDGSYLMMNSDLYSSVLTGHKLIVIVCDNGGFAVIHRLQVNQGGAGYNNLLHRHAATPTSSYVDFAAHARSMGCESETVTTDRRARGRVRARPRRRPHLRDRDPDHPVRLDRGRHLLGGRGAGGQRPPGRARRPRSDAVRQAGPATRLNGTERNDRERHDHQRWNTGARRGAWRASSSRRVPRDWCWPVDPPTAARRSPPSSPGSARRLDLRAGRHRRPGRAAGDRRRLRRTLRHACTGWSTSPPDVAGDVVHRHARALRHAVRRSTSRRRTS